MRVAGFIGRVLVSMFRLIFFGKIILQQFAYNLRNCYRHVKTRSEGFLTLVCRYLVSKTSFHDNFDQIMSLLTTAISYQGQTNKKDCAIFLKAIGMSKELFTFLSKDGIPI